jgi:hypothetical protein
MIPEFPAIRETQVVLLRRDLYIGHIVDAGMNPATAEGQEIWTVYDELESAIADANAIVTKYDHIECSLFDKDHNLLQLIQPS